MDYNKLVIQQFSNMKNAMLLKKDLFKIIFHVFLHL